MTDPTETARALLHRHGLPHDVTARVLALHAGELGAVVRADAAVWGVDTAAGRHRLDVAALVERAAGVPSADRAALRDRIRQAVCEAEGFAWDTDMLEPDEYGEVADAVLAVLPGPAATRTAALEEAALALGRMDYDTDSTDYGYDTYRDAWNGGVMDGAAELRRLAAEAGGPDTVAHPPEHTWAAELHDPDADEWVPGSRFTVRDRAVNALEHGRRTGPAWKDGTPTQRRLVRATTTYMVEPEPTAAPETEA
ncbi:hypothetical protein ABZ650_20410 [Streptomyces griseoviridis]|uniref:hypothetical protein n=1 Tax=Streptomyces griseoviridis TaxID=45398 RepID=UPI0033CE72B2